MKQEALDHVAETIEDLSGGRDPEGFDERTPDTIEVPGGIIDYNFNFDAGQNGEITFTRDDLLVGAVPQQVTYDNLEVSEVALSEGFTEIGELTFDEATGVYTIALNEGITRADVSGLTVDYQVRDWTAVVDAVATTLDESALTAVDDTAQGDEDTAILGSVADNDTTTSGGTLSYAINTDLFVKENEDGSFTLSQGVLTLDPEFSQNGQYSFQPNENYNGTDSFSYTVTDSESGERAVQTVTITVDAVNDAPVAVDDIAITTSEDTAVNNINVLGNDTDIDGDALTVSGASAANGEVTINDDGTLNYTPNANFNGTDTITYIIDDGNGGADTATVSVTVNPIVDIVADTAITDEDTAVTIDVLANDSFGPNASVTGVGTATSGTVEIVNGEVKYTPNEDFNGSDTFTYTVTTAAGDTETDNVSVTVNAQGDIVADTAITDEDTAVTIDVLANDSFGPNASVTGVGTATSGTVEIVNGEVKYTPNEDFNGSDTFTYTVTTAAGDTETDNVSVTVNAQGDIVADTAITDEDTAVTIDVLANDSFGPNASVTGVGTATSGTVEIVNGEVKYTPNEDFNGSDTFTYTVTTAAGDTETDNVSVTVNAQGDIVADTAITDEDTAVTIDVLANDSFGPNASVTGVGTATSGTVEIVNGEVKYTPNEDFNGSDTFTYTVTTAAGDTETDNVSVTVNAQGDIVADTAITDEDTAVTIDVLANDSFGPNASVTGCGYGDIWHG